ncbi:hypothetical protein HID58_009342 [Brassica napus]|uniref:C2H2-type domain-containing protein n=1 Tax=Brassica napus TaxID=3708 RepID=A0ABQ8DS87_BRANA|nr:uncharacterized protein LOC106441619 [Brassica napus]KAH0932225.1 hypothetical protein HID58_009342 [Brassica napus]
MSPSNSSSSPATDQRLNDIVVAVPEKSSMTNPKQVSPQEVVPEVNNPTQGSPQEVVPEVNNPKQVSPQEIVPEVNNPKQVSPQEIVPEVNNPKQVSPHQEVVPEVNNQKQASPQEVVHEMNNPKQVSPGEVVSQVNNPKQVSPQEVVPDPNNPKQGLPQEVVPETESKKTQRASFELRVLRAINKLIKKYPSLDNHSLICNICKRGFPNANSLGAHQKTHKHDLELERKLKQAEPIYSPPGPGQCFWKKHDNSYQGTTSNALSNDKHLGISRESIGGEGSSVRKMNIGEVMGYPSPPPYGNTNYGFSSGAPLVTHNYNRPNLSDFNRSGLSFGPFKPNGGGNYPYPPFTMNPSYGSHDSKIMNSISQPNTLGSCSNNNNNNSSSQGAISLELSLGPSKWMGGGNNNSSVYPSLNGGVTGGGSMDLNTPVRPLVSRNHFYSNYPLDSFTSNVPPPPPPSPATSLSNDENVPGSSLISKEKNKAMVVDDGEKDNGVTGGHDADKPAEV